MYTKMINPTSGRKVNVTVFEMPFGEAIKVFNQGGAKGLSLALLDQAETEVKALRVFEQGLDWALGLKALAYFRAWEGRPKRPKMLRLAVLNNGDVYVVNKAIQVIM